MAPSTAKPAVYDPPLIVPPSQTHQSTLIILHGRGDTARNFAEPFLSSPVSPFLETTPPSGPPADAYKTFRDYFPNTKFIFPTAPLRRALVFNRSIIHQWFDSWSLTQQELKQHLRIPGLRETSGFLHDLLRKEIEVVGAENVALIGISQGCASSLVATLLWEGEPFGGVAGMCGYLPFRKGMLDFVEDAEKGAQHGPAELGEGEDVFERSGDEAVDGRSRFEKAVGWLREELEMENRAEEKTGPPPMLDIPVFMGHGMQDGMVPLGIGKLAAEFLSGMGVNTDWNEYEGLAHWYSEDMLRDIVKYLKGLKGFKDTGLVP